MDVVSVGEADQRGHFAEGAGGIRVHWLITGKNEVTLLRGETASLSRPVDRHLRGGGEPGRGVSPRVARSGNPEVPSMFELEEASISEKTVDCDAR